MNGAIPTHCCDHSSGPAIAGISVTVATRDYYRPKNKRKAHELWENLENSLSAPLSPSLLAKTDSQAIEEVILVSCVTSCETFDKAP